MIKEFTTPYHSPRLSWLRSNFGTIFTLLSFVLVISFIAIFLYFLVNQSTFDFVSIFFILIPIAIEVGIFYGFYDYRNNLTQIELNEKGMIAFGNQVLWKDIRKVYRPMSKGPFISISFVCNGKPCRAFANVHLTLVNEICAYISENSSKDNPNFDRNQSLTLSDMLTCLSRPS
ncbi:hypothetical protein [Halobacteriovorax marinus]|uniref:hypothetical protein n=1 Tax=Halobacteriovorax marinus TaxID=97084 RepID=UPI003A9037E0